MARSEVAGRESSRTGGLCVSDADPATRRGDRPEDEGRAILEAKYHDYCSAQLADLLLYLSADEIYLLAEKAARDEGAEGDLSYARMVRFATSWLSGKVNLPPFDVWLQDYRAHPRDYEEYFMGLWESELKTPLDG